MKILKLFTLPVTLLLCACGGSGGGLNSGAGPNDPVSSMAITSANAEPAAKVAYETAIGSTELSDLGGSLGLTGAGSGDFAKPSVGVRTAGFLANVMLKIPFGPDVFPCAQSGSITVSGNLADPLTLTVNDNFVVESTACDDGLGEVVDGILRFTVTAFDGDLLSGAYLISMATTAENLQVSNTEDTVTSNGDVNITLDTLTPLFVIASVSGGSMTADSDTISESLTNYSSLQTLDLDGSEPLYTLDASGDLASTRLPGSVRYSTPVQFEGSGEDYPSVGELLVIGDSSSARLIAIDNVNVQIEVDSNGDGVVDDTISTTWAALSD